MKFPHRLLLNGRIWSALISAVSAVICAVLAGCKLYIGDMSIKDFAAEIVAPWCVTNSPAAD